MLLAFLAVVSTTLAAILGADWIRHREQSIVADLGSPIGALWETLAGRVSRALAAAAALAGVAALATGVLLVTRVIN